MNAPENVEGFQCRVGHLRQRIEVLRWRARYWTEPTAATTGGIELREGLAECLMVRE